jgi:2-oxoglutarate ferredoxin oxidoreductase subunit delta
MAGKIVIDTERCKGCGLCIAVCPKGNIVVSAESNQSGYLPAEAKNDGCTACTKCAIVCPEGIIEIFLDEADRIRIVATAGKKDTPHVIEEKR